MQMGIEWYNSNTTKKERKHGITCGFLPLNVIFLMTVLPLFYLFMHFSEDSGEVEIRENVFCIPQKPISLI